MKGTPKQIMDILKALNQWNAKEIQEAFGKKR